VASFSSRHARGGGAPIDANAVAIAERSVLPSRVDRDARAILESAANLTRLRIVRALAETPLPATDLARVVGRTPAATSQHLRVLRDIGAVVPRRTGNVVRYRLTDEDSAKILEVIARSFDALRDR
jgi:DNA-binding transcriptional ArsR family regulator